MSEKYHLVESVGSRLLPIESYESVCNPPTKKHQLKVEISRKLLQGEFL